MSFDVSLSLPPTRAGALEEVLEPGWRQFRISHGVRDGFVARGSVGLPAYHGLHWLGRSRLLRSALSGFR